MERNPMERNHGEIQLTSSKKKKKPNLEQEKSFQDSDPRRVSEQASERFLTGFETRGQLNHGPVFAQM